MTMRLPDVGATAVMNSPKRKEGARTQGEGQQERPRTLRAARQRRRRRELSLTEIAERTGAPSPSVFREIERGERAGLLITRRVGRTRLARANTESPYYAGLAEVLTRAFGVPAVLSEALKDVPGIAAAYVYGSWAARHAGETGQRPVGDIDVLVLGEPDRDQLYEALSNAERQLSRAVEATIRDADWLETGTGAFHDTVARRPLLKLDLPHQ